MSTSVDRLEALEARVALLEQKLASSAAAAAPTEPAGDEGLEPAPRESRVFDPGLAGHTLLILGGAYLLRAMTEARVLPVAAGVALGVVYAVSWALAGTRASVDPVRAAWYGVATTITALPLVFEAIRRFRILGGWTASALLLGVAGVLLALAWRRRLHVLAWIVVAAVLGLTPLLMAETTAIVPFVLLLLALGMVTLWMGYLLEWTLLGWVVAAEVDIALLVMTVLVVTGRLSAVVPSVAIAAHLLVLAAYLGSFAVRTLIRERDVVPFEIAQTTVLLAGALGGAMVIASNTATLEVPIGAAVLGLAAASYAVSFAFIPKRFSKPANFVFYSSLGLMLVVGSGAFLARGAAGTILWAALSLVSSWLAVRFRKPSLALHATVFLASGIVSSGALALAYQTLVRSPAAGEPARSAEGAFIVLAAAALALLAPPIERRGSFELWSVARALMLAEFGCVAGALAMARALDFWSHDPAAVSVARTSVLGVLTLAAAFAVRFPSLSPARLLCDAMLWILALKLLWEDLRVGRPATLFASLTIAGVVLLVTPRWKKQVALPQTP